MRALNEVTLGGTQRYFVMEDSPNISLSMHEAYIQLVAFTPSLLQRAWDDELSALTPVMKPRAP